VVLVAAAQDPVPLHRRGGVYVAVAQVAAAHCVPLAQL
jgi:hypothetical protein